MRNTILMALAISLGTLSMMGKAQEPFKSKTNQSTR